MALTEKKCECEGCDVVFVGRNNAKFCSDLCRWRARDKEALAATRGRANRAKGARAEREVCDIVNTITGAGVKRNLSQTRDSGSDVQWGPFLLEVKYQRTYALPAWQRQASDAAKDAGLYPAVVYRRPNEKFWISLEFETFITMFEALRRAAEGATECLTQPSDSNLS